MYFGVGRDTSNRVKSQKCSDVLVLPANGLFGEGQFAIFNFILLVYGFFEER